MCKACPVHVGRKAAIKAPGVERGGNRWLVQSLRFLYVSRVKAVIDSVSASGRDLFTRVLVKHVVQNRKNKQRKDGRRDQASHDHRREWTSGFRADTV